METITIDASPINPEPDIDSEIRAFNYIPASIEIQNPGLVKLDEVYSSVQRGLTDGGSHDLGSFQQYLDGTDTV